MILPTTYPKPVAGYLKHVLQQGQRFIRSAHMIQKGEIRLGKDKPWLPFQAEEYFSAESREFVWEAKVPFAPFINLRVRDSYLSGKSSSELQLFSIPLSREQNSAEMNLAALQRYLAECVWAPTALREENGLMWLPIDDQTAFATLNDCSFRASLKFCFNKNNEITTVSTPGRYRKVGKKFVLTPWTGRMKNYKEVRGILIPFYVDVEWLLPEGSFSWFRAEIVHLHYEFDEARRVDFSEMQSVETAFRNPYNQYNAYI